MKHTEHNSSSNLQQESWIERDLKSLRETNEELKAQVLTLEVKIKEFETIQRKDEKKIKELSTVIAENETAKERLRNEITTIEEANKRLQKENKALDIEKKEERNYFNKEKAEFEQLLEKQQNELLTLTAKFEALNKENNNLSTSLENQSKKNNESSLLEEQIVSLKATIEAIERNRQEEKVLAEEIFKENQQLQAQIEESQYASSANNQSFNTSWDDASLVLDPFLSPQKQSPNNNQTTTPLDSQNDIAGINKYPDIFFTNQNSLDADKEKIKSLEETLKSLEEDLHEKLNILQRWRYEEVQKETVSWQEIVKELELTSRKIKDTHQQLLEETNLVAETKNELQKNYDEALTKITNLETVLKEFQEKPSIPENLNESAIEISTNNINDSSISKAHDNENASDSDILLEGQPQAQRKGSETLKQELARLQAVLEAKEAAFEQERLQLLETQKSLQADLNKRIEVITQTEQELSQQQSKLEKQQKELGAERKEVKEFLALQNTKEALQEILLFYKTQALDAWEKSKLYFLKKINLKAEARLLKENNQKLLEENTSFEEKNRKLREENASLEEKNRSLNNPSPAKEQKEPLDAKTVFEKLIGNINSWLKDQLKDKSSEVSLCIQEMRRLHLRDNFDVITKDIDFNLYLERDSYNQSIGNYLLSLVTKQYPELSKKAIREAVILPLLNRKYKTAESNAMISNLSENRNQPKSQYYGSGFLESETEEGIRVEKIMRPLKEGQPLAPAAQLQDQGLLQEKDIITSFTLDSDSYKMLCKFFAPLKEILQDKEIVTSAKEDERTIDLAKLKIKLDALNKTLTEQSKGDHKIYRLADIFCGYSTIKATIKGKAEPIIIYRSYIEKDGDHASAIGSHLTPELASKIAPQAAQQTEKIAEAAPTINDQAHQVNSATNQVNSANPLESFVKSSKDIPSNKNGIYKPITMNL